MRRNRHDTWKGFCETHRDVLARAGLAAALINHEGQFRDWLTHGEVVTSGNRVSLAELTPGAWAAVRQFAAAFFREFESFAPEDLFPAFRDEVARRGDSFPR